MGWPEVALRLQEGQDIILHPKGNSMTPKIKSGQRVKLSSFHNVHRDVEVGDIVLAHLGGRKWYIHLVTAIDWTGLDPRYQISNNHGHINGWTRHIYGVVTEIG